MRSGHLRASNCLECTVIRHHVTLLLQSRLQCSVQQNPRPIEAGFSVVEQTVHAGTPHQQQSGRHLSISLCSKLLSSAFVQGTQREAVVSGGVSCNTRNPCHAVGTGISASARASTFSGSCRHRGRPRAKTQRTCKNVPTGSTRRKAPNGPRTRPAALLLACHLHQPAQPSTWSGRAGPEVTLCCRYQALHSTPAHTLLCKAETETYQRLPACGPATCLSVGLSWELSHPARFAWHFPAVCHLVVELCISVSHYSVIAVMHCGSISSVYCSAQMVAARPTLALVALAAALPAALGLSNAVVQWQNATEQVVRDFNVSNQISAKYYALTNIAQYQALLANAASGDKLNSTAVTGTAERPVTLPAATPCACKGSDKPMSVLQRSPRTISSHTSFPSGQPLSCDLQSSPYLAEHVKSGAGLLPHPQQPDGCVCCAAQAVRV